jgi:phosphoesterase RecJ-like protein
MNKKDIKAICDLISQKNSFLVISHKNPDGDAIGSAIAFTRILEEIGKEARVVFPDEPTKRLRFITGGHGYMTPASFDTAYKPELVVSLDCATSARLGAFEEMLGDKVDLSIDHHFSNAPFAKLTYTDAKASATAEIVYEIAAELVRRGELDEITPPIAFALYSGIVSDTGNFKYSNTSDKTFKACAALRKSDIDTAEISRLLFDSFSLARLKAEAIAISKIELIANGYAAMIVLSQKDIKDAGLTLDDFDDTVNIARRVEDVKVGAYMREAGDGEYKVSLRSNDDTNVSDICGKYSGGGHIRAAGCVIKAESISIAADMIKKDIEEALL